MEDGGDQHRHERLPALYFRVPDPIDRTTRATNATMTDAQITEANVNMWLLTGDEWAEWFESTVDAAQTSLHLSIYMISSHWRAPELHQVNLVRTLENAALRGLTCRGIIDKPNVPGRREPFNIAAARKLTASGWKIRVIPDARTLHEKTLLIDKRLSVIGSHNLSKASAVSNYDTSLAVDSPALADKLYRQFWERWRIARPLRAEQWQS